MFKLYHLFMTISSTQNKSRKKEKIVSNNITRVRIYYQKTILGVIMKRSIGLWQLWGFALTSLLGTLLHFLYDLIGEAIWTAPFSGVNESTWEHMKLLFWPMIFFAVFQSFFFRERPDFWSIKIKGILLGLALIPILFYTYNGAIGKSPDWLNITIFFVAAAISYVYEAKLFKDERNEYIPARLAITTLSIIALAFIIFTFYTPRLEIFKDPITGAYGI